MKYFLLCLSLLSAPALADQDADFLSARAAFTANDERKLDRYAKRLADSPLELYVAYYQMRLHLVSAPTDAIKAFLVRPDDSPMLDNLRSEWLKMLGRREQWDLFDSEYPRLINQEPELTCYALLSRLRTQPEAPLLEARLFWLSSKGQPESCATLFEAARKAGIITEQDVWQRLRLALESGNVSLAKQLAKQLSKHSSSPRAISAAALDAAARDAAQYLGKAKLEKANEGPRAVALFALQRLAKQSPNLAAKRWEKIAAYFPPAEQHYFYGWLGYEAARSHDKRALQWYKAAGDESLNDLQIAWRARAALREQNWVEVLTSINAMNPEQRNEDTWRYWKARALQATNQMSEAVKLYAPLSGEFSFYGQLASDELSRTPLLSSSAETYQPSQQDIDRVTALPGVRRTIELYRLGMRTEAWKEWSWALRNLSDHDLLSAAEIARRHEMYDRAIGAADKTVAIHDFSLRYLAPYRDSLQAHILKTGLDEAWVYGLMRQESRFATGAKSDVGAAGLMQIMPSTARWVAKRLGLKSYRNALISELDTNLKLGTYYMKSVLSSFDDSPVLASAAYNAGPGRANEWRADQPLEGAIYAETIKFDETRDYVKKVMSNTVYYARQFGSPSSSLKARLGTVPGRDDD